MSANSQIHFTHHQLKQFSQLVWQLPHVVVVDHEFLELDAVSNLGGERPEEIRRKRH
jgi:hypothetical protein